MGTILLVTPDKQKGTALITTVYKSKKKLKIEVKVRSQKINYDIVDKIIIPLTFGTGNYVFTLYEQKSGTTYTFVASTTRFIELKNHDAYRLHSNDYVFFNEQSSFYEKALSLKTEKNIYNYILRNYNYDFIKAILVARSSFKASDIEECYQKRRGICQDLATLTAAMMRICGIPAALVLGKANRGNHAWVEVNEKIYDPAMALTSPKKKVSYLAERFY